MGTASLEAGSLIEWLLSPGPGLFLLLALIYTSAVHLLMSLAYHGFMWHWALAALGLALGSAMAARAGSHLPALAGMHLIEGSLLAVVLLLLAGIRARTAPETNPMPHVERPDR